MQEKIKNHKNKQQIEELVEMFVKNYSMTASLMNRCLNRSTPFLGLYHFIAPTESSEREQFITKFNDLMNA